MLLLAPLVAAAVAGLPAASGALWGAAACGAAPWLLHRFGACGGGDVKLLAAVGALSGTQVGLEIELGGLVLATLYGTGKRVVASLRSPPPQVPIVATQVRLGPWILVASAATFAARSVA